MNLTDSLRVALIALAANKLRSVLTMLGVIIGVGAVIAMISIAQGAKNQMMSSIQSMGTNVIIVSPGQQRRGPVMGGMGSAEKLTLRDVEGIVKSCEAVKAAAPEVRKSTQVKFGNQNTSTAIIGTTPDYFGIRGFRVEEGRSFNALEVKSKAKVCIVCPTVVTNLFGEESPLNQMIRINRISFKIIGVMESKGQQGWMDPDDQIFVPVTTAMKRIFKTDNINSISVESVSLEALPQATEEIEMLLRRRHRLADDAENDFTVRTQAEITQMAETAARTFMLLLGGIASVSLLVGGIGIMNIMLVSVTERTREIGIRKAVGARRRDILVQFLIESVVLSLIGGVIGILVGVGASRFIATMAEWRADVTTESILLSFFFAAAIGIFFGIYPAQKAAALDPIEALRYE